MRSFTFVFTMQDTTTYKENAEESSNWLYCEDERQNKYIFYKGHPAFLARFTGMNQYQVEGMEERFSFSDPQCLQLIAIAERKGASKFGLNVPNVEK
ncbi:MAG: hypothetical protein ACRDE2_06670 [Chitinophagaceae bacterium]